MAKLFPALDRYILRLVIVPMVSVFAIAASLLLLDKMLRLFEFVSTEGGPVGVVFKMLAALIPEYTSLAIPLGLLLGILLAFRKLATSSELDVMRGVGLSYGRLLRVPYMLTAVLLAVNVALVFYVQPVSRYYYEQLQYELRSGALGASIKVGEFTTLADRMALRIEESENDGRTLKGIFARVSNTKGDVLSISAREGSFLATTDSPDTIILRLTDGAIVQDMGGGDPDTNKTPRVLSFSRHDLPIDLPRIEQFRARGDAEREYILPELLRIGWSEDATGLERDASQASFNFRMVEVVMMLLMPLLALALAIPPKRSSSALGVFVSIVMVVAYHKVNQYGEDVASLGRVDPILALWGPFVVFAAIIGWMYWQVAHVPGGQAIGGLESAFAKIMRGIRKLFKWRSRDIAPLHDDSIDAVATDVDGNPLAVDPHEPPPLHPDGKD
ncbi:Lipopolysaccharide export system permease protein LptF [Alteripontixanthobacter maritimus]|uniref:Lipopolysaccharide export system permease protein LptF n=1 Tax=Alteripontixanthobacter maritimus TaxID=2161824 RepID=A0A369Q6L0_9SPHN|nr:LptF/LptG family permease [Alteripontixanthobacter maritimus]RDC60511.1 Lipopolysaccharide export system permease protein LptF [Alteripontixanthobacter maritimus]